MLPAFSFKMWVRCGVIPSFLLGLCSFSVFWSSCPSLGAFWARFWRDGARFWRFFGCHLLHTFQVFGLQFSTALALCWSTFFTRIWCWKGCWGYAKSLDSFWSLFPSRDAHPGTQNDHEVLKLQGPSEVRGRFGFQGDWFTLTWFALNFTHFYFEALSSLESCVGLLGLREAQRI